MRGRLWRQKSYRWRNPLQTHTNSMACLAQLFLCNAINQVGGGRLGGPPSTATYDRKRAKKNIREPLFGKGEGCNSLPPPIIIVGQARAVASNIVAQLGSRGSDPKRLLSIKKSASVKYVLWSVSRGPAKKRVQFVNNSWNARGLRPIDRDWIGRARKKSKTWRLTTTAAAR